MDPATAQLRDRLPVVEPLSQVTVWISKGPMRDLQFLRSSQTSRFPTRVALGCPQVHLEQLPSPVNGLEASEELAMGDNHEVGAPTGEPLKHEDPVVRWRLRELVTINRPPAAGTQFLLKLGPVVRNKEVLRELHLE